MSRARGALIVRSSTASRSVAGRPWISSSDSDDAPQRICAEHRRRERRKEIRVLRRMTDVPAGTIGFEAVGEVEDDDWERAVEPVLREEIAAGRKVRLLYLLGAAARDVEGDAMKADTSFRARHASSFERVAVVSDEDWIRPAVRGLSFLLPGKAKGFRVSELDEAKAWLTAQ
jgi:hypothetical protein